MFKNRLVLIIHFLKPFNEIFECMDPELPRAASFGLELEQTKVGLSPSRSLLRDLGHQEPEPLKKVADPQHCYSLLLCNQNKDNHKKILLSFASRLIRCKHQSGW